ncbi:efflux RND transporter periplasmic adaptor subunit [Idiomarina xiamenensis]|uniref:Co/Zn/Cd efflux system protein n=1 Tax=Idiomarina xiamenensis 10-D-4 TaxID=740709 RepID=K2K5L7_9GAMM|nr:efflux RND transporter periplasmic adaptor subunit [Idiomarina xiamenensis]EKE82893.1 Co/Zn/Cd efflux system protein [Idiomarina xiamenensis 10-D-4]
MIKLTSKASLIVGLLVTISALSTNSLAAADDSHAEALAHTELSQAAMTRMQISTAKATAGQLALTRQLYGVVVPRQGDLVALSSPYRARIIKVTVQQGQHVDAGQQLALLENLVSGSRFQLLAPIAGEVVSRQANVGEIVEQAVLFEVLNSQRVWVELSAFPADVEALEVGQTATLNDLHQHRQANGTVSYISPQMSAGHIAKARIELANESGHWRPGMHVSANVRVAQRDAEVVVKRAAIQTLEQQTVVFVRQDQRFIAQPVTLGIQSGDWVEVTDGLAVGSEYVDGNSYLLKADLLKQGASHSH